MASTDTPRTAFDGGFGDGLAVGDDGQSLQRGRAELGRLLAGIKRAAPFGELAARAESPAAAALDQRERPPVLLVVRDEIIDRGANLLVGDVLHRLDFRIAGLARFLGGLLGLAGGFADGAADFGHGQGFLAGKKQGFNDADEFHAGGQCGS